MKANGTKAVWVVVVGVMLFFTQGLASADGGPGKQALSGVWQVAVVFLTACGGVPSGGGLPTYYTFTTDGKVIEAPGTPLTADPATVRVSPGLGSWQHEGGQQFGAVFRFFLITVGSSSVPANLPAGSVTVTEAIELSKDGSSFTSTGTGDFFDSTGNPTAHTCHTLAGTRL